MEKEKKIKEDEKGWGQGLASEERRLQSPGEQGSKSAVPHGGGALELLLRLSGVLADWPPSFSSIKTSLCIRYVAASFAPGPTEGEEDEGLCFPDLHTLPRVPRLRASRPQATPVS